MGYYGLHTNNSEAVKERCESQLRLSPRCSVAELLFIAGARSLRTALVKIAEILPGAVCLSGAVTNTGSRSRRWLGRLLPKQKANQNK